MPFEPFNIPLVSGLRQDITGISVGDPQLLEQASNLIITHNKSLRGRPGLVSNDAIVQRTNVNGSEAFQSGVLSTAVSGLTRAGLEASDDQLLALWQGTSYARTSKAYNGVTPYRELGPFWSVKKQMTPILDYRQPQNLSTNVYTWPTAVGTNVASPVSPTGSAIGISVTSDNALDLLDTVNAVNYDLTSIFNVCIATNNGVDLIVYPNAAGEVRAHRVSPTGTPGAGTEVVLAAAGSAFNPANNPNQIVWVVAGQGTDEFFICYRSSTAGRITVLRYTIAGGVTATLNLNGLGTIVAGVSMAHNGGATGATGALCIGYADGTGPTYRSKIINCTNTTTLTDAALNVNHFTSTIFYSPHTVGFTVSKTEAIVCGGTDAGSVTLQIDRRSFTSTANFLVTQLKGAFSPTPISPHSTFWTPLTTAVTFSGKTVVGVMFNTVGNTSTAISCQWYLLDLTNALAAVAGSGGPACIVANSPANTQALCPPGNAVILTNGNIKFGVAEGITFDINGPSAFGGMAVELSVCPARGVPGNGSILFSGCTSYCYDGVSMAPSNFLESAPIIITPAASIFVAGGSALNPGSYSFQAVWEMVNFNGQVVRSDASNIVTASTTPVNKLANISVTLPLMTGRYITALSNNVRIKLYATTANPSAGAPLYLVSTFNLNPTAGWLTTGSVVVTAFSAANTDTTQEQLYTGGNVLGDQPPPCADRGVAFVSNRVWVADSKRVYASKLLKKQYATSWNSSGVLTVEMPTIVGEIRALSSLVDKLVVHCDKGIVIVFGAGFDDLGNGPGWTSEVVSRVPFTKQSGTGPRSVTDVPGFGCAFLGLDNEVWLMDYSGTVQCISRATKDQFIYSTELNYCSASNNFVQGVTTVSIEHGAWLMTNGSTLRIFDIETGQWFTWTSSTSSTNSTSYCASLNGIVFNQVIDSNTIASYDNWLTGKDYSTNFSQVLTTSACSVAGPQDNLPNLIWGRLRGVGVISNELNTGATTYDLNVSIVPDNGLGSSLMNKTVTISPPTTITKWPYTNVNEFRCTKQRCSSFNITLTATPALTEWAAINFWAWSSPDRAPSRARS